MVYYILYKNNIDKSKMTRIYTFQDNENHNDAIRFIIKGTIRRNIKKANLTLRELKATGSIIYRDFGFHVMGDPFTTMEAYVIEEEQHDCTIKHCLLVMI